MGGFDIDVYEHSFASVPDTWSKVTIVKMLRVSAWKQPTMTLPDGYRDYEEQATTGHGCDNWSR